MLKPKYPTSHAVRLRLELHRHLLFTSQQVRRKNVLHVEELSRLSRVESLGGYLAIVDEDIENSVARVTSPIGHTEYSG